MSRCFEKNRFNTAARKTVSNIEWNQHYSSKRNKANIILENVVSKNLIKRQKRKIEALELKIYEQKIALKKCVYVIKNLV